MDPFEFITEQCKTFIGRALMKVCPNLGVRLTLQRVLYERRILPAGGNRFPLENAVKSFRRSFVWIEGERRSVSEEEVTWALEGEEESVLAELDGKFPLPCLEDVKEGGAFDRTALVALAISFQGKWGHIAKDRPLRAFLYEFLSVEAPPLMPTEDLLNAVLTLALYHDLHWGFVRRKTTIFRCFATDINLLEIGMGEGEVGTLLALHALVRKGYIGL
jgi:hypothetical protein